MRKFITISIVPLLISCNSNTSSKIGVGFKAPEIEFSECLNEDISIGFLKNKTIVLEFWATWCAPCIAGFPHINELSDKFSSNDVIFLSITKEQDARRIKNFFEKRTLNAYNLIDKDGITNINFKVEGIPKTIVIGKDGTMLWDGYYSELTENLLGNLILNQKSIFETDNADDIKMTKKVSKSDFELNVSLSKNQNLVNEGYGSFLSQGDGKEDNLGIYHLKAKEASFVNFFGLQLNGFSKTRVETNKDDFNIDVDYNCNNQLKNPNLVLINTLKSIYDFEYKRMMESKEVWVLKVENLNLLNKSISNTSKTSWASSDELFSFVNQPLTIVSGQLERFKNEIVTPPDLEAQNNYTIEFPNTTWEEIRKHLLDNYGLKLVKEKRDVEVLSINFK